jgi:hypothetical protein
VTEAEECDAVALIADGLLAVRTPGELRRRALGGEVIEVATKATFDAGVACRAGGSEPVARAAALAAPLTEARRGRRA